MDKGDGIDIDKVIKNSSVENTENLVLELLKNGEIFESYIGCNDRDGRCSHLFSLYDAHGKCGGRRPPGICG